MILFYGNPKHLFPNFLGGKTQMNYLWEIIHELILNQEHIWCDSKLFQIQALNWEHLYGGNTSVKCEIKNNSI